LSSAWRFLLPQLGPLQETLDFLLDLFGDFLRTSVPLTVVEAGGAFFVESVEPFVDHWAGDIVNVGDLRSRISSTAQKNNVGADCDSTNLLAFHPPQFLKLLIVRLANGSVGHGARKVP